MAERTTPGNKVALTIAGSDASGCTGIQADLKVFAVMDVFGAAAITAVIAQNTGGVKKIQVLDPEIIEQQIDAVANDMRVNAVKVGMLGSAQVIEAVAKAVRRGNLFPLVVDPVMLAKSGDRLLDESAVEALCKRKGILSLAAIVTTNGYEAARLLGGTKAIEDIYGASEAAKGICAKFGAKTCIVKGIKVPDNQEGQAVDVFFDGKEVHQIASEWRPTPNTLGAGSTFSAAITAAFARGEPLGQAVQTAKNVVSEAIRQTTDLGHGTSPVNHLAYAKLKK